MVGDESGGTFPRDRPIFGAVATQTLKDLPRTQSGPRPTPFPSAIPDETDSPRTPNRPPETVPERRTQVGAGLPRLKTSKTKDPLQL